MQNNVSLGISLMVVTTFMFSTMDGVSKYLAETNNVFTLVTSVSYTHLRAHETR